MSGEKALVPELRFPEFEREWEKTDLGSICKISTGKLDANAMVDNGAYPFFTCAKQVYAIDRFAFDAESLLVSGNGANVGYVHYYSGKFNAYQRTYVLTDFDMNIKFIEHYLVRSLKRRIYSEVNEGNTPYIVRSTLSDMRIPKTCSQEQQKIAAFLDAVSKKITLLTDMREALTDYKRGVMHRLFSGTLRFTRPDGSAFPDWEERKLGDVFEEIKEKVGQEAIPTFSISAGKGFVSQAEKFGKDISGQQNERYTVLREGDFAYNKGNSKQFKYGCIYPNDTGMRIAVPNVFISFRRRHPSTSVGFFAKLFENHHLDRGLRTLISSGARMDGLLNVNKQDFFKLKVPYPHPEEQTKIADALSALDAKIDAVSAQISQMEDFKKGLLQKMFV